MSAKTIMHSTLAAIALTTAIVTATATIGSTQAEARRAHVRIVYVSRHAYYPRFHRPLYVAPYVAAAYARPCHWQYIKANTGSPYCYRY